MLCKCSSIVARGSPPADSFAIVILLRWRAGLGSAADGDHLLHRGSQVREMRVIRQNPLFGGQRLAGGGDLLETFGQRLGKIGAVDDELETQHQRLAHVNSSPSSGGTWLNCSSL